LQKYSQYSSISRIHMAENPNFATENTAKAEIIKAGKIRSCVLGFFKELNLNANNKISKGDLTIITRHFEDGWRREARVLEKDKPIVTHERIFKGETKEAHYSLRKQLSAGQYVKVVYCEIGEEADRNELIRIDYGDLKDAPIDDLSIAQIREVASIFELN
jgi:hypothetical protein